MPRIYANQVEINYDVAGTGETLVLVHGGWSDRNNWMAVVPELARYFTVVTYDRRGHGLSQRGFQGSRRDQEDDLAALIEGLGGGAVNVAGTSFGGSIAIGLASRRPELVRSVIAHEPPLISVAAEDPEVRPQLEAVQTTVRAVCARVERGDASGAAEQFVEEVALGPGAWELLPPPLRETMVDVAPAFVAEQNDPAWAGIELAALANIECPLLLTEGDQSPPWFSPIVAKLAQAIDGAEVHTYRGARTRAAPHAPERLHRHRQRLPLTRVRARRRGRRGGGLATQETQKGAPMTYRHHLPQLDGGLFLTDGGIETTLIFHEGLDLPLFAAFDLLSGDDPPSRGQAARRRCGATSCPTSSWLASTTWASCSRARPGGPALAGPASSATRTSSWPT